METPIGTARSTNRAEGIVKEHQTKLRKQHFARLGAESAIAVAEIEAARYARLRWPARAIGGDIGLRIAQAVQTVPGTSLMRSRLSRYESVLESKKASSMKLPVVQAEL